MMETKRFGYIDALRGWAILSVIAFHCVDARYIFPDEIKTILLHGNKGVQLFYIISAFTIFLTLKHRSLNENNLFASFYIRRFFRIAPMYYLAICSSILLFIFGIPYQYGEITTGNILSNVTFTHGIHPDWINGLVPGGWSITVEMMFYVIAPFLFRKLKTLSASIFFLIGTLFVSALYNKFMILHPVIDDIWLWGNFIYFSFPNQLPVFAAGVVLYFIIWEDQKVSSEAMLTVGLYILLSLLLNTFRLPVIIYFAMGFCLVMYSLSRKPVWVIVNGFSLFAGRISYSMYITHFGILYFLKQTEILNVISTGSPLSDFLHYILMFVLTTLCTVGVSVVFYRLVEYSCLKLGKNIVRKLQDEKSHKVFA